MIPRNIDPIYLNLFCTFLNSKFGIFIDENKKEILSKKIAKLMSDEDITSSEEYYRIIVSTALSPRLKKIQQTFIDNVTIHKTNFFRENNHFEFIKRNIDKIIEQSTNVRQSHELRVWSSACSTGEEPYTLAILFNEILPPHIRVKILATDISTESIQKAQTGKYKFTVEDNISSFYIQKYFTKEGEHYWISDEIKRYVTFRLFNLMDQFPFNNPFDIIFCRNVMIYFNRETQEKLVNNFYNHLSENGLLFIGHSESLIQIKHNFGYHEPTIYKKTWNKKTKNRITS